MRGLGPGLVGLYFAIGLGVLLNSRDGWFFALAAFCLVVALACAIISAYHRGRSTAFRESGEFLQKQIEERARREMGNGA